jgi:hypothetical protein
MCSWWMWEERLERRCRRNTQQESIVKLLLLFQEHGSSFQHESIFHGMHVREK